MHLTTLATRLRGIPWRVASAGAAAWLALAIAPCARANVWISEIVADNKEGLRTAAGQAADWIELHNSGPDAVDLSGWHLTDQAGQPALWRFPDGVTIAPHGYLVIFADSSGVSITNKEIHTSFSLNKEGEYLALILPDRTTVADAFVPEYPPQIEDVSYGRALFDERELIGAGSPVRYRIPNADGTAPWTDAAGALGFTSVSGAFTVRYYEMNIGIDNIDAAESMAASSAYWRTDRAYPITGEYDTIDFHANSDSGYFGNNALFPGHDYAGQDKECFVVIADGAIYVPAAGQWTFAVGSDDGFRLRIRGHGVDFESEFATGRSFGTTLATFNFPIAGVYDLNLVYYENYGGASVELSAARDFQGDFSFEAFRLVGDPAGGILHAGAIGSFIETDVAKPMKDVNSRLDAEYEFLLDKAPSAGDAFVLSVRCADGFSAWINGVPVAALHAPEPLLWNSAAVAARPLGDAVQWLSYPVPASLLVTGANTLAIAALNDSAADSEFLIQPRLTWRAAQDALFYFKTPTPRAANGLAYSAPTPIVTASEPRGYKTAAFNVSLDVLASSAPIRYTLDGSNPKTNSTLYTGPISVSKTTTLRAAVVDPRSIRQNVTTVTWLFIEDIVRQSTAVPGGWPANRQVNNHVMEYGMRESIVSGDPVRLRNGMTNAIATISLVTDRANLFNPQTGIYVNPGNDGRQWERPVSVEIIDPVRGADYEFQIDAGIRIRGAYSRSSSNPKHSFRLFFRSDYGDGKLRFPLFDDEGASEFDKVDLRTSQNYSWAYENSGQDTFVREVFSRDSQRDMGKPYTRSRYYHLYINGQYWGLYQTQERGDADFAATYLGGNDDDWDCIKTTIPGYTTTASDGTFEAFYALHQLAVSQGFSGSLSNNYLRIKGLNPNGTPNPAYPVYLDEDNLIVYMLVAYYTGDPDSPVSIWGGFPNNMYGLYNRRAPGGFQWLRHDAEHSLGAHGSYPVTCNTTTAGANFTSQSQFNPATLHQRLCTHPAYRMRFADLVQKHLYGDGALTPANAQKRFRARMDEIDLAIIAESARWGRGKTRDANWLPVCNTVLDTYLAQRRDILIGQFRARGWFPSIDAPVVSDLNATVPSGHPLRISSTRAFYYTTDGSDPRLPDGSISPSAIAVASGSESTGPRTLIPLGAEWRYYDAGAEPASSGGLTWRDAGYPDDAWARGPAVLGFAGSATANSVATVTRRYVNGVSAPQVTTTYLRRTFTLDAIHRISTLLIDILRDDGAWVYLNGTPILRENMNAGATNYADYSPTVTSSPDQNTYFARAVDAGHILRTGTNILAVELHQCNAGSSDLYFDLALTVPGDTNTVFADLVVTNDLAIKARAINEAEWSALSESTLTVERPPVDYSALRVSELMYAPPAPPSDSPYASDDFAWLELRNAGAGSIDLEGVRFAAGIAHTFGHRVLAPGARLVLAKNPAAFAARHATNLIVLLAWESGNLARSGETLSIAAPSGTNILTFTYSRLWHPETYDTGISLVAIDLGAPEPLWSTAGQWRASRAPSGSPGWPDAPAFTSAQIEDGRFLLLDAIGIEDTIELWISTGLDHWTRGSPDAWSRTGDTIRIDLQHPSLPADPLRFFQIRLLP
ncbi:MAG TPA: lamin tail domain-containing protein [Candidatus Paceibacterota bacterium]|nr:lamin tail domain-containing protein [Candidatus Paceibacterota bacterium]